MTKQQSENDLVDIALRYIDFQIYFRGHVSNNDVAAANHVSVNQANDFIEHYRALTNVKKVDNIIVQADDFKPLYAYSSKQVLFQLSQGLALFQSRQVDYNVQQPSYLNVPNVDIIARLSRAIKNGNVVNVIYTSLTNGSQARDLIPHTIVDNGLRWYVRAYDRKSNSFRDFVLTRISKVSFKDSTVQVHETKDNDNQWNTIVPLVIVPHPRNVKYSQAIEMDYGMVEGQLLLNVNAAVVGYLLRRWNVDCSADASLTSAEYQLYLSNFTVLQQVQNNTLAPGFNS